ncbi:uncharacterized protein [Palaemon carinicauda]|uniref:uncharacterized protein n=1 Tax=Palaemon carinicauda TaxID=392227 RepID=UPI0035B5DD12
MRCLREQMVPVKYVRIIQGMCWAHTRVGSSFGETNRCEIGVGLHQVSARSPFIFNIEMDVTIKDFRKGMPWSILCEERKEELEEKLDRWRAAFGIRGMGISRKKTEHMCAIITEHGGQNIRVDGEEIKRVQNFKYLRSIIDVSRSMDQEVTRRMPAGWNNWRSASGVLCDKKVPMRLKGTFYRSVVRKAMLYGTEITSMRKAQEKVNASEVTMGRWMSEVTRADRI